MGDLIEIDFGREEDTVPEQGMLELRFLTELWRGLGAAGVGRLRRCAVLGSAAMEYTRQHVFELQHSDMPALEAARRRDLLECQIQDQHGLLSPPSGEYSLHERLAGEFPNGPRQEVAALLY